MTKLFVCAVHDSALQAFGQPIFVPSIGVALRSFTDEVNRVDDKNQLNTHPSDFILHQLAEYDDTTGTFIHVEPRILARAADVLRA